MLKQINVCIVFENGRRAVIKSPERTVAVKARTKAGWWFVCFGLWIIFGHRNDFRTILDPVEGETDA